MVLAGVVGKRNIKGITAARNFASGTFVAILGEEVSMECIQGCQMFLSGGSGIPSTNERGECSCACGDEESWSEYNILGRASCVPKKAHLIYGALGLLATVASLCHAMHQFNRQVIPTAQCNTPFFFPISH